VEPTNDETLETADETQASDRDDSLKPNKTASDFAKQQDESTRKSTDSESNIASPTQQVESAPLNVSNVRGATNSDAILIEGRPSVWADKQRSKMREEFIKLLFPIAVGVGFAEHMTRIVLHQNYTSVQQHRLLFDPLILGSGKEIVLLGIALIAVILSWQWYFPNIEKRPLEDSFRFFLDVLIVVAYLLLLLTSWLYEVWFWTLAAIWWLYLGWDVAVRVYCKKRRLVTNHWSKAMTGSAWALTVTLLAILNHPFTAIGFTFAAVAALAGAILYRMDQVKSWHWGVRVAALGFVVGCILVGARWG